MITEIYNRVIMLKDRLIIADGKQTKIINNKNMNKLFDIDINILGYKGNWYYKRNLK